MLTAVSTVQKELQPLKSDECFQEMFDRVTGLIVELDLQEIKMPRKSQKPARFETGQAVAYHGTNEIDHYNRHQYFQFIESINNNLEKRSDSSDIQKYKDLETVLLTARTHEVLLNYNEFDHSSQLIQLKMFQHQNKYGSVTEAAKCL